MHANCIVLLFLFLVAPASAAEPVYLFSTFRGNGEDGLQFAYSRDGYEWQTIPGHFLRPDLGRRKFMRDPSIARDEQGTFHLVWTTGWKEDQGFGYASSKDLVNWSEQRFIPAMRHEPETVNVWAPEVFYDKTESRFLICWASTIPGRFPDHLEPHDNNQRMYYTTTTDFREFAPTKLFFDPGFSVIDCCLVPRESGEFSLILKDNTRPLRLLKVAHGPTPLGPWTDVSPPFTQKFTEGPTTLRLGDAWIVYFDAYGQHTYGAMKTTDFVEFEDISDQVHFPEGHKHGTLFEGSEELLETLQKAGQYREKIAERSAKIVAALELTDRTVADQVERIVVDQYVTLSTLHDQHAQSNAEVEREIATLHRAYVARLAAWLTAEQVDQIKNGMTYHVAPKTFEVYCEKFPTLDARLRNQIHALLFEAREHAMDAGSSDEKHKWFRKYKGKINNILSAAGYKT